VTDTSERPEDQVPSDLLPAIKALRKTFDDAHWKFGRLTQVLCFARLHESDIRDVEDFLPPLQHAKVIVGPVETRRFHDMLKLNTPPAIFKGFFDFYMKGVNLTMLAAFEDLAEIGRAHERELGVPHLKWAAAQALALIRYNAYRIKIWVRDVCDVHPYDPNDKTDENIFWRKWQAPLFLIMKPLLHQPYDPQRVWERKDVEASVNLLEHFADVYVLHLEVALKTAAGAAAIRLAKEPKPVQSTSIVSELRPQESSVATLAPHTPTSPRREAGKLDTQEKYRTWQRQCKALSKSRPDMSDVWYSQQIAKMSIAKGSSAETIRKRMK